MGKKRSKKSDKQDKRSKAETTRRQQQRAAVSSHADIPSASSHPALDEAAERPGTLTERLEASLADVQRQSLAMEGLLARTEGRWEEILARLDAFAEEIAAQVSGLEQRLDDVIGLRQPVGRPSTELAPRGLSADDTAARELVAQLDADLERASARIGALSVRAEAYGEIIRTRLEAVDRWFDDLVDRTQAVDPVSPDQVGFES